MKSNYRKYKGENLIFLNTNSIQFTKCNNNLGKNRLAYAYLSYFWKIKELDFFAKTVVLYMCGLIYDVVFFSEGSHISII